MGLLRCICWVAGVILKLNHILVPMVRKQVCDLLQNFSRLNLAQNGCLLFRLSYLASFFEVVKDLKEFSSNLQRIMQTVTFF